MKPGIINSDFQQFGIDRATGLKQIARIGCDCVNIFNKAMTITAEEKLIIARTGRQEKLPIVSAAFIATSTLTRKRFDYEQQRSSSLQRIRRA